MPFEPAQPKIPHHLGALSFNAECVFPPSGTGDTFEYDGQTYDRVSFGTAKRSYKICDANGAQIEWSSSDQSDLHPYTVHLLGQALAFQATIDAETLGLPIDLTPQ